MHKVYQWCAAMSLMAVATTGIAQQRAAEEAARPRPVRERPAADAPERAGEARGTERRAQAGMHADEQISHMLIKDNQGEIHIAKFALERLDSPAAQKFAQMLIDDHSKVVQMLEKHAGQRREAAAGQGFNWVAIHNEIADKHVKSIQKELSKHQGIDFEQGFLGHQVAMHLKMVDKLEVLQGHVSAEMQPTIEHALKGTREHLKMAQSLMNQKKDRETTATRPETREVERK